MTMTLSNGNVLSNLELNGNNYVSTTEITTAMFQGGLSSVIVTDDDGQSKTMTNCELVQIIIVDGKWYFVLRELTADEVKALNNEAQVLYTAIMTDTLIEEDK